MVIDLLNYCHGARYITHFYCLAVEAGFYSDVVECWPVDPATWVRFLAGAGKIFLLYDITCPSRESNPGRWIYRQTLYHVAVKACFYCKAVEVCYIPIPVTLCKSFDIHIVNGRCGADSYIDRKTCKISSVIDYVIMSPELFPSIHYFEVLEFDPLLSDIHCPEAFTMNMKSQIHVFFAK